METKKEQLNCEHRFYDENLDNLSCYGCGKDFATIEKEIRIETLREVLLAPMPAWIKSARKKFLKRAYLKFDIEFLELIVKENNAGNSTE